MGNWPKPLIGLTGGIGTGKSTVAAMLLDRGAMVIDADKLGHEVLQPDGTAYAAVVDAFGPDVLAPDGTIDRAELGARVFADPEARARLEAITHPAIGAELRERLQQAMDRGPEVPAVVLEIVLLVETGYQTMVDEVWVTTASEETVVERVGTRSGLAPDEVRARRAAQIDDAERTAVAAVVLQNDGTPADLETLVQAAWERLVQST